MAENRNEYFRKYRKTDKNKQYTKNLYLDKVKDEYRDKTCEFLHILHTKTRKSIRNEIQILEMIDNSNNPKEVRGVYENLIHLIEIS